MKRVANNGSKPLGVIWINCTYPVVVAGLSQMLQGEAWLHVGQKPPKKGEDPSCVVFCVDETEGVSEGVQSIKSAYPSAVVIVFGLHLDMPLAWAALRAGARGFVHAKMQPEQMLRALKTAFRGEIAAPRSLLEYLIDEEQAGGNVDALSARQREIIGLIDDGLSNAMIAKRLVLSESTVKQHLRAAYKVLGVSNRTQAVRLVREGARDTHC